MLVSYMGQIIRPDVGRYRRVVDDPVLRRVYIIYNLGIISLHHYSGIFYLFCEFFANPLFIIQEICVLLIFFYLINIIKFVELFFFKYVFEYRIFLYLIFGLYLKSICKYNQIHKKIPTKGKALPDITGVKTGCLSHLVRSGQAPLRRLVNSEVGQTLASMYEWEASEAHL